MRKLAESASTTIAAMVGFSLGLAVRCRRKRRETPVVPDAKEIWLVRETLDRIVNGNFGEPDVLALLILLRRHAPRRSAVLEFADFVAHRTRDRGRTKDYLEKIRSALRGQPVSAPVRLPLFTVEQLQQSVNQIVRKLKLSPIDVETANRLLVCIICMLQTAEIETTFLGQHSTFTVGISSQHVVLSGQGTVPAGHVFAFDMLVATNNGYDPIFEMPNAPRVDMPMRYEGIAEASCVNGQFRIEQRTPKL